MIVDMNGNDAILQRRGQFSADEARLIRQYKRLLQAHGMGASHFCRECQRADRDFEIRIKVSDGRIEFECQHRYLSFDGSTY